MTKRNRNCLVFMLIFVWFQWNSHFFCNKKCCYDFFTFSDQRATSSDLLKTMLNFLDGKNIENEYTVYLKRIRLHFIFKWWLITNWRNFDCQNNFRSFFSMIHYAVYRLLFGGLFKSNKLDENCQIAANKLLILFSRKQTTIWCKVAIKNW